jgi:glycosyltransferase involved in cell wall biosynthesis
MLSWYANSLGVFFRPYDEDYGYVTLEAMLSAKPVITCSDSGGPREFVLDGETGFVVEPRPELVADAIDRLAANPGRAAQMGQNGLASYASLGITWDHVVSTLL